MQLLQSPLLQNFSNLSHCFTSKKHGNLAFHVNDNIQNVITNHKLLALKCKFKRSKLIYMRQIHSNYVHTITDGDNFDTPPICDAIITNKINTPLMVMVADCSPILFYDDKQKVIAVAHSGRAGTFNNIIQETLKSFTNNFNSKVEDIIVSIGASISQECYEVGREIYDEAKKLNLDYAINIIDEKYYLDIRAILKKQLLNAGVTKFEISDECNCCLKEKYYSYRGEGETGRFAGVIVLKSPAKIINV